MCHVFPHGFFYVYFRGAFPLSFCFSFLRPSGFHLRGKTGLSASLLHGKKSFFRFLVQVARKFCGHWKIAFSRMISRSAESDFSFSARCAPKLFRKGNPEAERGRKMPFEGGFRRYLKKIRFAKTESKCSGYSRPADRPTASFRIYFPATGQKESKNKSMLTAS